MALQGQSMFGAAGDTGAFACIRSDGTTIVNVLDPPTQPWVTSVGGTSFESFNPDANPNPSYPTGVETVWNVDNLCNTSADEGNFPGLFWCAETGAGGGGNSQFWGRPFYQFGPGINNPYTTFGNGTTQCALAATGNAVPGGSGRLRQCRRVHALCGILHRERFHALSAYVPASAREIRQAGSASAAPAYRRHFGRRSSRTTMASGMAGLAMRTRFSTCSITWITTDISTTSPELGKRPTTTVCSQPLGDMTWRLVSERQRWEP